MRDLADRFDELQSDLIALRKDASKLVSGMSDAAGTAVEAAGAAYDGAGKWTSDNIGTMRSSVRGQPLAAVLVSLGVGAVLGAIFLRR